MTYRLTLKGCDDETGIVVDLSDDELVTVRRLSELFSAESTHGCMPTLKIEEITA